MADISYDDLDPQDTDSFMDLRYKQILSIQASSAVVLGTAGSVAAPQTTDSALQLEVKLLESLRELQAALETA